MLELTTLFNSLATVSTDDIPEGAMIVTLVTLTVGGLIAIFAIVFGTIFYGNREKERERTRREVAAYVAEGSISPEDAERLLKAKPKD
ncbi:MAG: hypothetical protein EA376_12895 [Phycisphaeraceae bacterium]|nr:MAG: hypothetical protein EA376_12895 [Phycisphaeraceae bacterium]